MQYTVVVFGIVMLVSALTWIFDGRKNFDGPKDMAVTMARIARERWEEKDATEGVGAT